MLKVWGHTEKEFTPEEAAKELADGLTEIIQEWITGSAEVPAGIRVETTGSSSTHTGATSRPGKVQ